MSLLVWLPLNGNLENQGLSNIAVTNHGATVDNNGKIGKCYSFNGTNSRIAVNLSNNLLTDQYSISCWVYIIAFSPDSDCRYIMTIGNASGSADQMIGFYLNKNNTITLNSEGNVINTGALSSNIWYHLVGTYDGTVLTFYLNGIKVNSIAKSKPANKINLSIGSRSNATNNTTGAYYSTCKLNDMRVYDHCLSAKEVKDLAKGLVLHYRLAGPGQSNLAQDGFTEITCRSQAQDYPLKTIDTLKDNTQYTISFDARSENGLGTFYCSLANGGSSQIYFKTQIKPTTSYIRYNYTVTRGTQTTNKILFAAYYGWNGNTNVTDTIHIKNIKLEEGSVATPWCPHKNDALYNAMGYNNNIEYDCSGYRRNGTKNGTIIWDIDSPRYTTSYKFDGNNYITANTGNGIVSILNSNTHTIACWVKTPSNLTSIILPYFVCRTPSGDSAECQVYLGIRSGEIIHSYYSDDWSIPHSFASDTWYHIAFTSNNKQVICYVNGENIASTTKGALNISINGVPTVGADSDRNGRFKGNLADARIYATALSAEDIAELYHSAVIVDNTGKNYAYEYFEA